MAKYHINTRTGEAGQCRAEQGSCPFGGEDDHFGSKEKAREAYEAAMGNGLVQQWDAKGEAAKLLDKIEWIKRAAEAYEGSASELHRKLAEAHEELALACRDARLQTSGEEREAWRRTGAEAYLAQVQHEKAALDLLPRDARGNRDARRVKLAEAQTRVDEARDRAEELREEYYVSPAYESELAGDLHQEWAEARNFEPRMKDDGRGGEIDIANTPFLKLPYRWQEENLLAARSALSAVEEAQGNVEVAAAQIHRDWLSRNGAWAEPHQRCDYSELSEEEKEKDRVLARAALKKLKAGPLPYRVESLKTEHHRYRGEPPYEEVRAPDGRNLGTVTYREGFYIAAVHSGRAPANVGQYSSREEALGALASNRGAGQKQD